MSQLENGGLIYRDGVAGEWETRSRQALHLVHFCKGVSRKFNLERLDISFKLTRHRTVIVSIREQLGVASQVEVSCGLIEVVGDDEDFPAIIAKELVRKLAESAYLKQA